MLYSLIISTSKRRCVNKKSKTFKRSRIAHPFVCRTVSVLLALSLFANATPAAPRTIVDVSLGLQAELTFWMRANAIAPRFWNFITQQRKEPKVQEAQGERDARIDRIKIYPGDVTIEEGQQVNFVALAYDPAGNSVGGVKFKWSAQDEDRGRPASVHRSGLFVPLIKGNYKLTAEALGRSETVKVKVNAGKRPRKDEQPTETKEVSSRDLPPEALAQAETEKNGDKSSSQTKLARNSGKKRNHAAPVKPAPYFLDDGWGNTNYWSADDPGNTRGDPPGTSPAASSAGTGNFQFAAPVLSLSGRGMDVNLALIYNSRLWNKAGTNINYDIDRDWPAPGWSFGFGRLMGMGVNNGGMLIDPDGTRHSYTGTIQFFSWGTYFVGRTTDGSFIDYSYYSGTGGAITSAEARLQNGTIINYTVMGTGGVWPSSIIDPNGNVITITYLNNQAPRIQTVYDTLGRAIVFHYDSLNRLTAVTAPALGSGTRTLVRLHYSQLALNYSFSGLTPIVRDSFPWMIDAIYFPGSNTGYWLSQSDNSYSTYGMLKKVSERRNMSFSGPAPVPPGQGTTEQGTITAGQVTREEVYNYPLNTSDTTGTQASGLTNAPTYTSCVETWTRDGTNFDSATTTYEVFQNSTPRTITITLPNGLVSKQYSYNSPGSFLDGLVYLDETKSGSTVLQSTATTWESGAYGAARPSSITATNQNAQTTTTQFSYGSVYNQVTDIRSYDFGGALLRSTRTQYDNSANYTNRHIFSLPLVVETYAGDNVTRVSRTEFQYDGQPLADAPGVPGHSENYNPYAPQWEDCQCYQYDHWWIECLQWVCNWVSNYQPATDYRGNVTQITTYANAANMSGAVTENRTYDITGNMLTSTSSCCEKTTFNYTQSTSYGYPESQTQGSASDPLHRITSSTVYDFNTGLSVNSTDANGRSSQTTYDSASHRPLTVSLPGGAHTDFAYDDVARSVTETTYLQAHPTHTTIASQNVKFLNGRGQVWQDKTLGANSVWDIVNTVYDNMGRVSQQSRPYRSGDTVQWNTTTYDVLGRATSIQAADGSTSQLFHNESSRPSVASSAPGDTIRTVDAWGRERWVRKDSQARIVEVVEPDPNGSGSVATNGLLTTYAYTTQGELTTITQGSQTRSFKYDSLGRLTAQKLAERSGTLNDAGTYVGSGSWSDVFVYDDRSNLTSRTDARGVKTLYTYNNDPLNRLQSVSWDTSGFGDTGNPILGAPSVSFQYRTKGSGSELKDITQIASITTSGVSAESYSYDSAGRMQAKTLTLSSRPSYPFVTDYIYDSLDRVTDTRYPAEYGNGAAPRRLVHQDYDVASRPSGLNVDGQSQASNFIYNAAGQTTSLKVGVAGANQITENYGFSAQTGLLESQNVMRGAATLLNLGYGYTGANGKRTGQLTSVTNNLDNNKNRGYEYDKLGRLKRATGGQNVNWAQRYYYDRYGNRTWAFSHTAEQFIRNFYLKALVRQPNSTELNSWLSTLQTAYAQGSSQFWSAMQSLGAAVFTSQEYANRNRTDHWYVYDLYQAYLWRDPDPGGWAHWEANTASVGRNATRAGFDWSTEFEMHVGGTSPFNPPGGATVPQDGWGSLHYDNATNRINDDGWAYDAAGNQTRAFYGAGWQRFQYDAANRLVKVKADNNVTVLASYTYGSDNQRLIGEESSRTYYIAEGQSVIAEYSESIGSSTPAFSKSYVYLGQRLLSSQVPTGSGGIAVSYHHPDRLGTRTVSNNQNTTSFEQVTLPFGTALNSESTGSTNHRFTNYDRSATTSLDYALNRFYDSQQGRFTQVDPIGMGAVQLEDPQTMNLYAYCVNDPVNQIDPDGLGFFSFFKKLFKAILKVLTNKWVSIAIGVALAVISFGSSMGWWSLMTKVTKVVNIGMDLGWGVQTATTTVTQLTTLGKIAIGLSIAATIPSLTSVKGLLSIVAGYALGRVVGALGLVTAGATRRGTPEWNPNASGFQHIGTRRQRTFATMDEAAAAALRRINRRSRRENAEYAGRICERNGRFGYTRARRLPGNAAQAGSDPDQSPCPTGWNTSAAYHTHGANLAAYENERFSNELQPDGTFAGDIPFANAENRPVYLATPHRLMMVYDPAVGTRVEYSRATRHLPGVTP